MFNFFSKKSNFKLASPEPANYMLSSEFWHLIRDGEKCYLHVGVDASFASYNILIQLNKKEREDFRVLGWIAIQYLAFRINGFPDQYSRRNITGQLCDKIEALIPNKAK